MDRQARMYRVQPDRQPIQAERLDNMPSYSRVPKAHESGDFTADVMLKANFDTALKASGTINGFPVDGRKKNWSVSMQENTDGLVNDRWVSGKAVWEIDTRPNNADQDAGDYVVGFLDMDTDGVPSIVGGLFDVRNGNARMYGSFGATSQ